jgi:AraC-like DNA-binding protein
MTAVDEPRASIMIVLADHNDALGVPMFGVCVLSQDGHEWVLTLGEVAVVDPSHPCEIALNGAHRMLVAAVPRESVQFVADDVPHAVPRPVPGTRAPLPASWLARPGRAQPGEPQHAVPALIAVRSGAADRLPVERVDGDGDLSPLLVRIHRYIHGNLRDPDLSPHTIAAAHHISLRYLQKLFRSQGTTVNAWIRDRRLDRCRSELIDSRHSHRTIAAIGARWNLSPASYFSRVFREAYGATPTEVRAHAAIS